MHEFPPYRMPILLLREIEGGRSFNNDSGNELEENWVS